MLHSFETYNPHEPFVLKNQNPAAILLGAIFALLGLTIIALGASGQFHSEGSTAPAPWYLWGTIGAAFTLVGFALLFGRRTVVLDRTAGQVRSWIEILVPIRPSTYMLSDFDCVRVTRELRCTDKKTRIVYCVRLVGPRPFLVRECPTPIKARRLAERVAKYLRLPVENSLVGEAERRAPDELDMSLRERLRRHGVPEAPELPAGVEPAEIRKDGHTITIHLGRNDSAPLHTALFLFMAMLAATMGTAFFLFALHDAPSPINWVFGIFIALPVVVLIAVALAPVLRRRWVRTFVEISPDLFQVVWETPLLRRRQTIPMDELEELGAHGADQGVGLFRFLGGGHLIAVSDRKMITFAKDFQPERLRYLRDLICHTVATM